MVKVEHIKIGGVIKGLRVGTNTIPPAGILPILNIANSSKGMMYRYSQDGGETFTPFENSYELFRDEFGKLSESKDLVIEYLFVEKKSRGGVNQIEQQSVIYDRSAFKTFFDSDDINVLGWSLNVLEKLFDPGIVPMYVSRDNVNDFTTYFSTVTQFFAYTVIYARQYKNIEGSDLLMKNFIEGWGIVYENIDTPEQRNSLFKNWVEQFKKRGTSGIYETGGLIDGEVRRLVGYDKPNEFIFAQLAPQDIGWCLGYSSPTWYGTETVNAVSKGYDFGPSYSGENTAGLVSIDADEVIIPNAGGSVDVNITTVYPWRVFLENESLPEHLRVVRGVGQPSEYPIIGNMSRKYMDDMFVFVPTGTGRVGISTEIDTSKVMEVYIGLDYEVTVWVKRLTVGDENIDFGVNAYDADMNLVKQVHITDFKETSSFFDGNEYQSPCLVSEVYYKLTGIIYNISMQKQEDLYLNFQNGKPLRFIGDIKYLAPYIVQNRMEGVADIAIAGCTLKPLKLPFSQGYLGQKNVIAMYAQIRSARTKKDIQSFIKNFLVSYKNVVSHTWLDWVVRSSAFVTFSVSKEVTGGYIEGADVVLSNGLSAKTDINGYVRFEIDLNELLGWEVSSGGYSKTGTLAVTKDTTISVSLNLPLNVTVDVVPKGFGEVQIIGVPLPNIAIYLKATPNEGYLFTHFDNLTDGTSSTDNPLKYELTTYDVDFNANFERSGSLVFEPNTAIIQPQGGIGTVTAVSTKNWVLDDISEDWFTVTPKLGSEGDTPITITIE